MKEIIIQFPQIIIETKELKVSDEIAEEMVKHASIADKANFIWDNMTVQQQHWCAGIKDIESALEMGYCRIKTSN